MSNAMRNALQRRAHRERAQPQERQRLGLLEKRKDYRLRAADNKRKEEVLLNLRRKAADRNPDEFSFKMLRRKVDSANRELMNFEDSAATDNRRKKSTWTGAALTLRGDDDTLDPTTQRQELAVLTGTARVQITKCTKEVRRLEEAFAVAKAFAGEYYQDDAERTQTTSRKRKPTPKKVYFFDSVQECDAARRKAQEETKKKQQEDDEDEEGFGDLEAMGGFADFGDDDDDDIEAEQDDEADEADFNEDDDEDVQRKKEAAARATKLRKQLNIAKDRKTKALAAERKIGRQRAKLAKKKSHVQAKGRGGRVFVRKG